MNYVPERIYKATNGVQYVAEKNGSTLRRMDGGKLSKKERKAVKREAVREMQRERTRLGRAD